MNEWTERPLAQICATMRAGGTPSVGNPDFYDGDIPFVTIEDISRAGRNIENTKRSLSRAGLKASAAWEVPTGHLLLSMYATLGKVTVNSIPVATNQAILAIKPDSKIITDKFLFYFFQLLKPSIASLAAQTTQANLSSEKIRKINVKFPINLKVQNRIVEILSTVDETIERTEALIVKYQKIKDGLMHDLFTRGVTPDGSLRPAQTQAPELYKPSLLGWVPKKWSTKFINDIEDSLIDGPFGSNLKSEHYIIEPGVRVVRLQNIQEGYYNDNDPVFVSVRHAEYLGRYKVNSGDVLIAALGDESYPVGRSCSYPSDIPPAINKADCFRLRCNTTFALNSYIVHLLNTSLVKSQIRRFEQGVTRRRINLNNFRKVLVTLPETHEQKLIVKILHSLENGVETTQTNMEKLIKIKNGLMHDLLTGRLPVKVPELVSA